MPIRNCLSMQILVYLHAAIIAAWKTARFGANPSKKTCGGMNMLSARMRSTFDFSLLVFFVPIKLGSLCLRELGEFRLHIRKCFYDDLANCIPGKPFLVETALSAHLLKLITCSIAPSLPSVSMAWKVMSRL